MSATKPTTIYCKGNKNRKSKMKKRDKSYSTTPTNQLIVFKFNRSKIESESYKLPSRWVQSLFEISTLVYSRLEYISRIVFLLKI